jgi:signal transduction histidine kinase
VHPARRFDVGSAVGLEELAREQAALRRVATLVAEAAPAGELFAAVAEELGSIVPEADVALVGRYEPDDMLEVVGGWRREAAPAFVGQHVRLGGQNVSTLVFEHNAPARVDDLGGDSSPATSLAREWARSAAGAPINVEGRLWGVMVVGSLRLQGLPRGIEDRLASFTDLIATAIANSQAHDDLRRLADEQAALRRVATLVARGAPPTEIFSAVAEEVGGLLGPDHAVMARFDAPDMVSILAEWTSTGDPPRLEKRRPLAEGGIAKLVQDAGRTVRVDDYVNAARDRQSWVLDSGTRAAVAAPITVDGRLWGVMGVGSRGAPPPSGTEERLAGFTELVATAIANTQAREELRTMADEQAALRRVATLVAESAPGPVVFAAVAEEVGRLLPAERTYLLRFDPDVVTVVGAWPGDDDASALGLQRRFADAGLSNVVRDTKRPARVDRRDDAWAALPIVRQTGLQSAVAAPISVLGRVWGTIVVASTSDEPLAPGTEERLAGFTDIVATAISSSQARGELSALADEQAALRRVATLVAQGASPPDLFEAVAEEVGRLLLAANVSMGRYEPDDSVTSMASWSSAGPVFTPGGRWPIKGTNVAWMVLQTGRPARIDDFSAATDPIGIAVREAGYRSAIGSPIVVEGQLWGAISAASTEGPMPPGSEARLASFTELVATAIANAEGKSALNASRRRIVDASDETRRRIERDLHDGTQQRLVSLGLAVRAAEGSMPPEWRDLHAQLAGIATGLAAAVDDLQEISRGIHPAILSRGGLGPALRTLARRSAIPVQLEIQTDVRYPKPIELAVYFVASEALANAAKHSQASRIDVSLKQRDGLLVLAVVDDGVGGADPGRGSGLIGLTDRVEALGGSFSVHSREGNGTQITAQWPLAPELPGPAG